MNGQNFERLEDHVGSLQAAAKVNLKSRGVNVATLVQPICNHAYEYGLPKEILDVLIDIVTQRNHLDQTSLTAIVKNLYPAARVPSSVVTRIVCALGPGERKPPGPTQVLLTKWLLLVYDILEDPSIMSKLYPVLFNLLDMISLRGPLCHLLSFITRRKHVKPFRVQSLLELARKVGHEPPLVGLIRTYKIYHPDIIIGDVGRGRASYFARLDKEWRERLRDLQEVAASQWQDLDSNSSSFKVVRQGAKKTRSTTIPQVQSSGLAEGSMALEDIEDVNHFVNHLERIEPPNQAISMIADPLSQKFLMLGTTDISARRLESWLEGFLEDELQGLRDGESETNDLVEIMSSLLEWARCSKSLPEPAVIFLSKFIDIWNGENADTVLGLLEFVSLLDCEELQATYYRKVETKLLDNTARSKARILRFYTSVLRHWTTLLCSQPSVDFARKLSQNCSDLIKHADLLCLSMMETPPSTITIYSTALSFYETTASLAALVPSNSATHTAPPSTKVIYQLLFTTSISQISRLCSLLTVYKITFESSQKSSTELRPYPKDYVNLFNSFFMDIVNLLWRNRAFNKQDQNAQGCLLPDSSILALRGYVENHGYALTTFFSMSSHPVLSTISATCMRGLEESATADGEDLTASHTGVVGQKSLTTLANQGGLRISWADYRLEMLKWLDERNVGGIGELIRNTMVLLKNPI